MSRQTPDQKRAKHAWETIQSFPKPYNENTREFAREAKKLPMRILSAGLGQALVFLMAKANVNAPDLKNRKPHLEKIHSRLTDWVFKHQLLKGDRPGSLIESIIYGSSDFLKQATDEALAYLQWLNRFAEGAGMGEDQKNDAREN